MMFRNRRAIENSVRFVLKTDKRNISIMTKIKRVIEDFFILSIESPYNMTIFVKDKNANASPVKMIIWLISINSEPYNNLIINEGNNAYNKTAIIEIRVENKSAFSIILFDFFMSF